jgi:signal peptidase I
MDMAKLKEKLKKEEVKDFLKTLIIAGGLAVGIRTFAYEPFYIPSESMVPSLLVGDFLFVNKYAYGYSRYAFPFGLKLFEGRIFASPLKRGDVVVFHGTRDDRNYVKRLIGLPGDRVQMIKGMVYINGSPVTLEENGRYQATDRHGNFMDVPAFTETLPNGVQHPIIKYKEFGRGHFDEMPEGVSEYFVPANHYMCMGDNRDNSLDSRSLSEGIGYIPHEHIIGRAEIIFFSTEARLWQFWKWISGIRLNRFFKLVK